MIQIKTPPLVEIQWDDAHGESGWQSPGRIDNEKHEGCHISTVGYLLRKNKEWTVLTMGYSDQGMSLNVENIPTAMIKKTRVIRK